MADPRAAEAAVWLDRWGCTPDGAGFATGGGWLVPARRGAEPVMLKMVAPDDDEAAQGAVLAALAGRGAVRLWEQAGPVLLMERVLPGGPALETMALAGQDDTATHVLCDLIAAMQAALRGAELPALIPFDRRSDDMRRHLAEGRVPAHLRPEFDHAALLADEMIAASRAGWQPLHGDMHHMNALHDVARGWLAIDPKGLHGPPLYDYANTLLNPYPHAALVHDPARMARQAAIIAERAGAAAADVLRWTALHGWQCAAWSLFAPDRDFWLAGARLAGQLAGANRRRRGAQI